MDDLTNTETTENETTSQEEETTEETTEEESIEPVSLLAEFDTTVESETTEAEKTEATTEETTEASETTETTTEEKTEATTEETTEETAALETVADEPKTVPLATYINERRRRQEVEAQLNAAQADGGAYDYNAETTTEETTEAKPDHSNARLSIVEARVRHTDFQEKFDVVLEAAKTNPEIENLVLNSPNPGEAAYTTGRSLMANKEFKTSDPWEIAKQAEERGKKSGIEEGRKAAEAEFAKKLKESKNIPTNLMAARSAKGSSGDEQASHWATLSEML